MIESIQSGFTDNAANCTLEIILICIVHFVMMEKQAPPPLPNYSQIFSLGVIRSLNTQETEYFTYSVAIDRCINFFLLFSKSLAKTLKKKQLHGI